MWPIAIQIAKYLLGFLLSIPFRKDQARQDGANEQRLEADEAAIQIAEERAEIHDDVVRRNAGGVLAERWSRGE